MLDCSVYFLYLGLVCKGFLPTSVTKIKTENVFLSTDYEEIGTSLFDCKLFEDTFVNFQAGR